MRKAQQQEVLELVKTLHEAHAEIKDNVEKRQNHIAQSILADCQECAISIGNAIEAFEGEGFVTVSYLEEYCQVVFQTHESLNEINVNENRIYKNLEKQLIRVENSIKNDIVIRREMVFLPYKASMWDSLESVWKEAAADPNCDAYVIPIPYYDRNRDGSMGKMHYEGDKYPDYVPIIRYDDFDFGKHHPDAIFIHNPYDDCNTVTSVHPFFYSDKMKKCTDCLVYIPYFATSGGMSEGQALCPAYVHADYIVIQSEKYRRYYDSRIPNEKFLVMGSPKFDSVIHKCQNPPEPPEEWKKQMMGKKVYFYNTSIAGMLQNTYDFLKKMEYVFNTFEGRNDACLLWRPHPLLESTFDSMRPQYKAVYMALKKRFVEDKLGILDETPDIENTIALCDAYIGDSASSVTSLFGVAGKPLFILNNKIHTLPKEDDWKGAIIRGFYPDGHNQWYVTQGNKLYYSPNNDFHYEYFCELSEYAAGGYYLRAIEYKDKIYVTPCNAQDILVIAQDKSITKIELQKIIEQTGAFANSVQVGKYLFLIPFKYPALVRMDMETGELRYVTNIPICCAVNVNGEIRGGGSAVMGQFLLLGSATEGALIKLNIETLVVEKVELAIESGILGIAVDEQEVWMTPWEGTIVTCWNAKTREIRSYDAKVDGLACMHRNYEIECQSSPFGIPVILGDKVILSPNWGNKFVSIDKKTGCVSEIEAPMPITQQWKNGYYYSVAYRGCLNEMETGTILYYDVYDRKVYKLKHDGMQCQELPVVFDRKELEEHEWGFGEISQWFQYCCYENAFNSLKDFLDDNITGNPHDRIKQLEAFSKINVSVNGDCGKKLYQHIMGNV